MNKFKGVFESNPDIEWFDALVGFLRASGYFAIRPYLDNVPNVRILVGINVDQLMADYQKRGLLFLADSQKTLQAFREEMQEDIQNSEYKKEIEEGILQFVEDVASEKLQVKAHPSKRLHAKIYIFRPEGFNEHKAGAVITGSSNLTESGLGSRKDNHNYEFNVLLNDYDDVIFAKDEFERLWNEAISVLPVDIQQVREKTYLNEDITPFELYIKFLIEYFGKAIEYDPNAITDLPENFKRLTYQADAVNQGFELLSNHNGFFLADVVGLGKTIVAILIAKKYYFHNGFPEHRSHTLIVVPPAMKPNWDDAVDDFRLDNVKIITNGSLHKITNPEKYDLVIVDEAHKFRHNTAEAHAELQRICKTPTMRTMPDGNPLPKRVILVSATPLNNRPSDLSNQLALFQDLKDSTLSVVNLQHFFNERESEFKAAKLEDDPKEAARQVHDIYEKIRLKVLSEITVRRTRSDLMAHPDYSQDLEDQGIVFPTIKPPNMVLYQLSPPLELLYDRTLEILKKPNGFTYNRYKAISFLKPEKKAKYQAADNVSMQLASIMRTLLVKRLDSSFFAFKQSLRRFRDATKVMVDMYAKGKIYIAPKLNVTEHLIEGREDELLAKMEEAQETDPTIDICTPDDFEDGYIEGVENDLELLNELCAEWDNMDEDPKAEKFVEELEKTMMDSSINGEGKLVVFSESEETTAHLSEKLIAAGHKKLLTISASNRNQRIQQIRENFDANYTGKKKNDYDIIISTEVLAEGVNLHRANVIVNYDTPWNSTRLMQRIGRVNRIGTTAEAIHIFNFFPTAQVNDDIELEKKAKMKLQGFHSALGEDSQIYSTDEEVETFGLFEDSPEEERDERLALLMELRKFRRENPEWFRRIKNKPFRVRTGRDQEERKGNTVTFIRNKRRDSFFRVKQDASIDEITFLEAADEFKVDDQEEKAIPLHANHHGHINQAVERFKEQVIEESLQAEAVNDRQGPNERKALQFLDAMNSFDFLNDAEKQTIKNAKDAIRRARFQQLQRDVNKLTKAVKDSGLKPSAIVDKLMEILSKYPLQHQPKNNQAAKTEKITDTEPDIILSSSFGHPHNA